MSIDRSTPQDGIELLIQAVRTGSLEPFRNSGAMPAFSINRPPAPAPGEEPPAQPTATAPVE